MEKRHTGLAIASLILGIVAFIFSFIPYVNVITFILCLLVLIFSIITFASPKAKKTLAVIGFIISIIAFIIALLMDIVITGLIIDEVDKQNSSKTTITNSVLKTTDEILKDDVTITIGSFKTEETSTGYVTKELPVTIRNRTKETKSFNVTITAYDANGDEIKKGYVYATRLKPGETTTEKAFTYASSSDLDALRTAEFKVTKVFEY